MKLPLTTEEYEYIYSRVPRLNVEIIMKTESGIVLIKRDIAPWLGYWHLPGGRVYMGESLEQAVHRIALSEAGVKVRVEKILDSITYPSIKDQDSHEWPIGVGFIATITGGNLKGSNVGREIKEFKSLPEPIVPEQKVFIQKHILNYA